MLLKLWENVKNSGVEMFRLPKINRSMGESMLAWISGAILLITVIGFMIYNLVMRG